MIIYLFFTINIMQYNLKNHLCFLSMTLICLSTLCFQFPAAIVSCFSLQVQMSSSSTAKWFSYWQKPGIQCTDNSLSLSLYCCSYLPLSFSSLSLINLLLSPSLTPVFSVIFPIPSHLVSLASNIVLYLCPPLVFLFFPTFTLSLSLSSLSLLSLFQSRSSDTHTCAHTHMHTHTLDEACAATAASQSVHSSFILPERTTHTSSQAVSSV